MAAPSTHVPPGAEGSGARMALNRVKISRAAEKLVRQGRLDAAIVEYQRPLRLPPPQLLHQNQRPPQVL